MRLQIESEVKLQDALVAKLQERVLTPDGWLSIVRGIQYNDTHAYGVKSLHEWIMKKSGWPSVIKATSNSAFRRAVSLLLNDEDDIWACSIGSLQILAKIISTDGVPLTDHEKAGFLTAGKLAAGMIIENADNSDDVRSEAGELATLAEICGLEFDDEVSELEACADDLPEQPDYDESFDPESEHLSKPPSERVFDVDSLFAGLLDR